MGSFVRDVIRVGLSKALIILCGLGVSIITARYIGPEGNGIIAGLVVYPSLFMSIGSLGIRQSTTYFLGKGIYTEEQIKKAIVQIGLLTSFISVIVSFILMFYLSTSGDSINLILLALLPIPFTLFNTYNSGIFLGKNDIKTFNQINWVPSAMVLIATIIFVVLLNLNIRGAMLAAALGPIIMFFILLLKNRFLAFFTFRFEWEVLSSMLSLGIVYALALFVINLNYRIDIILLDRLSNVYEMGIYSKGAGVTQYLWQIPMLFSTIVFARSAVSKDDAAFSGKVAQLLRVSFVGVGVVALIFLLFSDFIIVGMYGTDFRDSISVMNYLLPGVIILTIYKVMNMDLAGKGKPWVAFYAMIPALIINVVLNFILIPQLGADGAAISSTISYSIAGVLFLIKYSRSTNLSLSEILLYRRSDFDPIVNILKKFNCK